MNAPLPSYPPFIRPLLVLEERIAFHSLSGGILEGLNYDREAKVEVKKAINYPLLQPAVFEDTEAIAPGANMDLTRAVRGTSPSWDAQVWVFELSTRKEYGFFSRDLNGPRGALEWLAAIRDAVELDESGKVDPFLGGTISKPIQCLAKANKVTDLCWTTFIEFQFQTNGYDRGMRLRDCLKIP